MKNYELGKNHNLHISAQKLYQMNRQSIVVDYICRWWKPKRECRSVRMVNAAILETPSACAQLETQRTFPTRRLSARPSHAVAPICLWHTEGRHGATNVWLKDEDVQSDHCNQWATRAWITAPEKLYIQSIGIDYFSSQIY